MGMINHNHKTTEVKTPKQKIFGGKDWREAEKLWKNLAASEARIGLLQALVKERIGLPALEMFQLGAESQFKSTKFKNQSFQKFKGKMTEPAMRLKLAD